MRGDGEESRSEVIWTKGKGMQNERWRVISCAF